jgi:hypothetical protein
MFLQISHFIGSHRGPAVSLHTTNALALLNVTAETLVDQFF